MTSHKVKDTAGADISLRFAMLSIGKHSTHASLQMLGSPDRISHPWPLNSWDRMPGGKHSFGIQCAIQSFIEFHESPVSPSMYHSSLIDNLQPIVSVQTQTLTKRGADQDMSPILPVAFRCSVFSSQAFRDPPFIVFVASIIYKIIDDHVA